MKATVSVLLLLVLAFVQASLAKSVVHLETPAHDPIQATRGLISRKLGEKYNEQVTFCGPQYNILGEK